MTFFMTQTKCWRVLFFLAFWMRWKPSIAFYRQTAHPRPTSPCSLTSLTSSWSLAKASQLFPPTVGVESRWALMERRSHLSLHCSNAQDLPVKVAQYFYCLSEQDASLPVLHGRSFVCVWHWNPLCFIISFYCRQLESVGIFCECFSRQLANDFWQGKCQNKCYILFFLLSSVFPFV